MRRLSAALVALTATVALVALAAPAWTAPKPTKTTERALAVSPTRLRPQSESDPRMGRWTL